MKECKLYLDGRVRLEHEGLEGKKPVSHGHGRFRLVAGWRAIRDRLGAGKMDLPSTMPFSAAFHS